MRKEALAISMYIHVHVTAVYIYIHVTAFDKAKGHVCVPACMLIWLYFLSFSPIKLCITETKHACTISAWTKEAKLATRA
jgi:hypothetical protein